MAAKKWGKCLVNKPGKYPDELKGKVGNAGNPVPGVKTTHLITATDKVIKGYFYVDTTWLWSGAAKEPVGVAAHPRLFPGYRLDRRLSGQRPGP